MKTKNAKYRAVPKNAERAKSENAKWYKENPEGNMLHSARKRAKKQQVPCTISVSDIVIPARCPVLGIPIFRGTSGFQDNSPSLDKIVPSLGYIPGNIRVISWRANKLKTDATPSEILLIHEDMQRLAYKFEKLGKTS